MIDAHVAGITDECNGCLLQQTLKFYTGRQLRSQHRAAPGSTIKNEMNAGIMECLAYSLVLYRTQAERRAAKVKPLAVEESQARHCFDGRFYVSHALYRPVIKHALDDVSVIAVHPVGEFVRFSGEPVGRGCRAEAADSGKIAVQ